MEDIMTILDDKVQYGGTLAPHRGKGHARVGCAAKTFTATQPGGTTDVLTRRLGPVDFPVDDESE
jgi:hypothetical protein